MGVAHNHIHPPNTHRERVARKEAAAIEWFNIRAFDQAEFAQAPPFSVAKLRPIDAVDDTACANGENVESVFHKNDYQYR